MYIYKIACTYRKTFCHLSCYPSAVCSQLFKFVEREATKKHHRKIQKKKIKHYQKNRLRAEKWNEFFSLQQKQNLIFQLLRF